MRRLPDRFEIDQPPDLLPRDYFRRHSSRDHVIQQQSRDQRVYSAPGAPSRRCLMLAACCFVTLNVLLNFGAFLFVKRYRFNVAQYQVNCLQQAICAETDRQVGELYSKELQPVTVLPSVHASAADTGQSAIHVTQSPRQPMSDVIRWTADNSVFTGSKSNISYSDNDGMFTINQPGVYLIYSRLEFATPVETNSTTFEHEIRNAKNTGHVLRRASDTTCHRSTLVPRGHEPPCYTSLIVSTLWLSAGTQLHVTADPIQFLRNTTNNVFGLVRLFS